MGLRIFYVFGFILSELNQSTSIIQYERFKRERMYYMATGRELKYKSEIEDKKKPRRGLFDDLRWMLEYNKNGLMSLFIYSAHMITMIILTLQNLVYSSFPTNRNQETGEFVNKYLRFVEKWLFVDAFHMFDSSGLLCRVIAFMLLRFITLRIRAIYLKCKRAKKNRYGYKEMNIVDVEFCYAMTLYTHFVNVIGRFYESYNHECFINESLLGDDRKAALEFNEKLKRLERIDRFYFYNQIRYDKCFYKIDFLDRFLENKRSLDLKLSAEQKNFKSMKPFEDEEEKLKLSWLQYIFYIELPNRVLHLQPIGYRNDVGHGIWLILLYIFISIGIGILLFVELVLIVFLTLYAGEITLKIEPIILSAGIKMFLSCSCIAVNSYDNVLLGYSSILAISRAYKINRLLKGQIEFYRHNQRKFSLIHQKYPNSNSKVRRKLVAGSTLFSNQHTFDQSIKTYQCNKCALRRSLRLNESDQFHKLALAYRHHLPEDEIKHFNENLDYLLDLIEVMFVEHEDHKKFYTTFLNINIVFAVFESSVALALMFNSENYLSLLLAVAVMTASCGSLIGTLISAAGSEFAVSYLYNT